MALRFSTSRKDPTMAQHVLAAAHSYTLVAPDGKSKTVVRRGHSIDNLPDADKQYLASKSITPPVVDDSHPSVGRMPLFHPVVDSDVRGEAVVEQLIVAPTTNQPYAGQGPAQVEAVKVSVEPVAPAAPAAPAQAEAPAAPAAPPVPEAPAAPVARPRPAAE